MKIISRCSCGEPVGEGVGEGYVLCEQCVAEVNRKAMALMNNVIVEVLGLKPKEKTDGI